MRTVWHEASRCASTPADALEQDLAQPRSSLLGAPGEEFESNPWRELQEAAAIQLGETFTPLCFITHPRTDTQVGGAVCGGWGGGIWITTAVVAARGNGGVWVPGAACLKTSTPARPVQHPLLPPLQAWLYWNLGKRQLCIAFRGTEQDNWRDYLTDISLAPALLDPAAVPTLPLHRGRAWGGTLVAGRSGRCGRVVCGQGIHARRFQDPSLRHHESPHTHTPRTSWPCPPSQGWPTPRSRPPSTTA